MDAVTTMRQNKYNALDKIFAFLYAIIVIVQPLRSFLPVTLSMAIIIVSVPYLLFLLLTRKNKFKNIAFVTLYAVYRIINHGTSVEELITMLFLILLATILNNNRFDFDSFFKWTVRICCLASACVILQVVMYYIANVHISFLHVGILREDLSNYERLISTGMTSNAYRPSAFFLEPSAFTQYAYPVLFYLIFKDGSRESIKYAFFISLGIIASTSGMGIMLTILLWGVYLFYNCFRDGKLNRKWFGLLCLAIVACMIAYFASLQLQYSVQRIFQGDGVGNSAIQGRLEGGQYYVSQLNRSEFIFGTGDTGAELTLYMSGVYHLVYTDGILCAALFFLIFIMQALTKKGLTVCCQLS